MEEIKKQVKQALEKYGLIGLIVSVIISVILTIIGWILSLFAGKTNDEASFIRKEAIAFHDEELESVNAVLKKLGNEKIEAVSSFERFISAFELIKNRPTGLVSKFEKVKLPKIEIEEMKKLSDEAQAIMAQGGGAAVGLGLGLAAFGVEALALAPAALAGGIAVCVKGVSLRKKAIKNKKEALELKEEINKIVGYYRNLARVTNDLFGCFVLVKHQYLDYLDRFCSLVESNQNWKTYSADDKILVQNTILLVKLENNLCGVNLVNKAKNANSIETVNEKEVSQAIENTHDLSATVG